MKHLLYLVLLPCLLPLTLWGRGKVERYPILFGHQDDTFYGIGWDARNGGKTSSDIQRVCGDLPAVMGFELGDLELGRERNLDGVPFTLIRQEMAKHLARGGVVTISWHPNNILTGGNAWEATDSTVVQSILPGGHKHEAFRVWMDRLADFLLSLPKSNTEGRIIFRPWHENNGSWFWWGRNLCSPQQYKALWCMLQDYLMQERGIEGLQWSYSPNFDSSLTEEEFLTRYPGDERVQLLGLDAYQNEMSRESFQRLLTENLRMLCRYAEAHNKAVALTECGQRSVTDDTWWTGSLLPVIRQFPLRYVLCWRNGNLKERFAPYRHSNDSRDFRRFAKQVIMLKNLQK